MPNVAIARQSDLRPNEILPIMYAIKAANNPPVGQDIIIGKSSPPKYPVFAGSID